MTNFDASFTRESITAHLPDNGQRLSHCKWFETQEFMSKYVELGQTFSMIFITTGELDGEHKTTRYYVFKEEDPYDIGGGDEEQMDV